MNGRVITADDYTIVVPSRLRVHNMPTILKLLPTALICVEDSERASYAKVVPPGRLLVHPPMRPGLAIVNNWMLHAVQTPIFIEIDDDFVGINSLVGNLRFITDPREILQILENSAQACSDLGLGVFAYSRNANSVAVKAALRPIVGSMPVCNAWGAMNSARHRLFDGDLVGRADIDYVLRTLLEDRIIYGDTRYYFNCGRVFGGRGGNVGVVTKDQFEYATKALAKKWGEYVAFPEASFGKKRSSARMRINVQRRSPLANK